MKRNNYHSVDALGQSDSKVGLQTNFLTKPVINVSVTVVVEFTAETTENLAWRVDC